MTVTDPFNHTMTRVSDAPNRAMSTVYLDGTHVDTEYDANSNRTASIGQANLRTQYAYDDLNRLTSVTDAMGGITSYAYDELGNRISQTDANNHTTSFAYDQLGRRISRTLPMGEIEHFTYYADGQQQSHTDLNGKTTSFNYDIAGRLTDKIPDPFFNAPTIHFTYFNSGRRHTMTDVTGITTYSYDSRDRLLSKATPEGSLFYSYDNAGNRLTAHSELTGGYNVQYGYDDLNRLSSVTDLNDNSTTHYHYDTAGRMTSYDYPNGVTTTMGYDPLNRVQNVALATTNSTPTTLANFAYTLYPTGNRNTVSELGGRVVTWSYDHLWRLTNETIAGSATAGSIGYTYDAVGNRLSRTSTVPGIADQTEAYNSDDENNSAAFDADGNAKLVGSNAYAYDFENRLTSFNTGQTAYAYDGDGQLIARNTGGTTMSYLIDAGNPTGYPQIVEERSSAIVTKHYVYGFERISMKNSSGVHYYGYDGHSGVRTIFGPTAFVTDHYEYEAFGTAIVQSGTTDNMFTYRSELFEPITGFQYLRARWLALRIGRSSTRDPFEGFELEPSSLAAYQFAAASPVDLSDPSRVLIFSGGGST